MWVYSCYSKMLRLPSGGKFGLGLPASDQVLSGTIHLNILDAVQEKIREYYKAAYQECRNQAPPQVGDGLGEQPGEHP